MINKRVLSSEKIFSMINTKYYDKKISELRGEIARIRNGRAGSGDSDIRSKENSIKYYEREKRKYAPFISEVHATKDALLRLVGEESRHAIMYSLIDAALNSIPDLSPKYRKMFSRASSREYNQISFKQFKAKKKALKKSKKVSNQMIVLIYNERKMKEEDIILSEMLAKYDIHSVSSLFMAYEEFLHQRNQNRPHWLGLDAKDLERIKKIINNNTDKYYQVHSCVGDSLGRYNTLLRMKTVVKSNSLISVTLNELFTLYKNILIKGQALYALNIVLDIFGKTTAKEMPLYKKLEQICSEMVEDIRKSVKKANEKYDKKQIVQLKEKYDVLEKAYGDYLAIRIEYSKGDIAYLRYLEEVGKIRRTMLKALEQFPELNNPKYEIDIVNGVAKDKAKLVPPKEAGEETVSLDSSPKKNFSQIGSPASEEDNLLISPPIIIPEHLASYETSMYSKYSEYKKSPLGNPNITFLEFLRDKQLNDSNSDEKLSELIVLLEKKKARIDTIYKSYLKYRANLKDKNDYLTFYSWTITFFKKDRYDEEFILRKDDDTGYEPGRR